jgi:hypothetical protein
VLQAQNVLRLEGCKIYFLAWLWSSRACPGVGRCGRALALRTRRKHVKTNDYEGNTGEQNMFGVVSLPHSPGSSGKHAAKMRFCAALFSTALLSSAGPAAAAQLTGFTVAPNWAFGSPQPVLLFGTPTSDVDPFRVFGHFGLGGLSDVLDVGFIGVPVATEASFSENARLRVFGLLEAGNERLNDWWDLTIPNARFLFNRVFNLFDFDDARVGDRIVFRNIGGRAHIRWGSNNSDDTSDLPADFVAADADITDVVDVTDDGNGKFSLPGIPGMEQIDAFDATTLPTFNVPEPASLLLLGPAIGALLLRRARERRT